MCLEVRVRLLRVERIRIWGVFSLRRSVSMAGIAAAREIAPTLVFQSAAPCVGRLAKSEPDSIHFIGSCCLIDGLIDHFDLEHLD